MRWFDTLILKRIAGLLARRVIDIAVGALLATSIPVLVSLADWARTNNNQLEALIVAIVLGLSSAAWSFLQKKADIKRIKRLGG